MGAGGADITEAIFGPELGEAMMGPAAEAGRSLVTPPLNVPFLKPVKPEFKRRRRRQDEFFDLFGTLLTEPTTGALAQPPVNQPKKLLGA